MNCGRCIWAIVVNQDFNLILNYCNWVKKCFLGIEFISLSLISALYLKDHHTLAHALSVPTVTLNCSQESLLSLVKQEISSRSDWEAGLQPDDLQGPFQTNPLRDSMSTGAFAADAWFAGRLCSSCWAEQQDFCSKGHRARMMTPGLAAHLASMVKADFFQRSPQP